MLRVLMKGWGGGLSLNRRGLQLSWIQFFENTSVWDSYSDTLCLGKFLEWSTKGTRKEGKEFLERGGKWLVGGLKMDIVFGVCTI